MPASLADRFWSKVHKTAGNGCWLWTAYRKPNGYGGFRFRKDGKWVMAYAHRVAFEMEVRPLSDGENVCHHCDVKSCVRPDHLFAGTQSDNLHDAGRKGKMTRNVVAERNPFCKLSREAIQAIRAKAMRGRGTKGVAAELAATYNTTPGYVRNVWRGKSRKDG